MRVRTEARHQAIIAIAAKLFLEHGFERTTMAEVAARLGGSKSTLYRYFATKDELFAAVMMAAVKSQGDELVRLLGQDAPIADRLRAFGRTYLTLNTSPDVVALNRIMIAEGERARLGALFYERGPLHAWRAFREFVAKNMPVGSLAVADPWRAAMMFKGLLEADLLERRMRGAITSVTEDQIASTVDQAAELFLTCFKLTRAKG